MVLDEVSPQPIFESDTVTISAASTPPESIATDNFDDDPYQIIQTISSSVPWPGSTFIIRSAGSANVVTLRDGQIVLALPGTRGSNYWECVETNGWLGFKDPASGMYLGHDIGGRLRCAAKGHSGWENFCARARPEGGYVLMMTHWAELRPVGGRIEDGIPVLEKVQGGVEEGIVWDFVRVQ